MVVSGCGFFFQEKGGEQQHIHKDNGKLEESKYDSTVKINEILQKINPTNGNYTHINKTVTVLIALDDQIVKYHKNQWINNGSTKFQLGSHHNETINEKAPFFIPLLKKGDCVIFGGDLVHCAGTHNHPTLGSRKMLYFVLHLVPRTDITAYTIFDVNESKRIKHNISSINKENYAQFIYSDKEWRVNNHATQTNTIPSWVFDDDVIFIGDNLNDTKKHEYDDHHININEKGDDHQLNNNIYSSEASTQHQNQKHNHNHNKMQSTYLNHDSSEISVQISFNLIINNDSKPRWIASMESKDDKPLSQQTLTQIKQLALGYNQHNESYVLFFFIQHKIRMFCVSCLLKLCR